MILLSHGFSKNANRGSPVRTRLAPQTTLGIIPILRVFAFLFEGFSQSAMALSIEKRGGPVKDHPSRIQTNRVVIVAPSSRNGTRKSFALRRYRPDPEDYTFLSGGRHRQIIGSSGFGV